jgi:(S)-mandelate dehydrogenase
MTDSAAIPAVPAALGANDGSKAATLRQRFPMISDLRERAIRRLPKFAFDFIDGGAGSEACIGRNFRALEAIEIVPRYSVDYEAISSTTELFGRRYAAPIGIAPMGQPGMVCPGADQHLARAAQKARIPYTLATLGSTTIEAIAPLVPDVFWFQVYRLARNDHAVGFDLIRRAERTGAHVLVVTFDSSARSKRPRDLRNNLIVPLRPTPRMIYESLGAPGWLCSLLTKGMPRLENFAPYIGDKATVNSLAGFVKRELGGNFSWDEIARIRELWPRAMVLKGVLHPDDAERAVSLGIDGIQVSNHGGRVFEGAPGAADVLPGIVRQIGQRATVLMDSGIRSGLDVVRAMALGATATFTGRPFLYGLGALGPEGPQHVIDFFLEEIRTAFGQSGARTVGDVKSVTVRIR